jgi:tetratricopeptide (TPR) repeat protein
VFFQIGDNENCIESATQAIINDPEYMDSYHQRGLCLATSGDYAAAVSDFDVYLATVTDNPHGWYNRGLSYNYLGNKEQALSDYSKALEIDTDFISAYINRGNVYVDLQEYELAVVDYKTALTFGDVPLAYFGLGKAYVRLERYEEAIEALNIVTQLQPDYPLSYGYLEDAYLALGEYEAAIEAANQFLVIAPEHENKALVLQGRGRAYIGLGDYESAIDDLTESINLYSATVTYYYRGVAFDESGQTALAIFDLELFIGSEHPKDQTQVDDANARLARLRE